MNNSTENEDDYRYAGFGGLNFNEDVEIELPDIANTAVPETDDDEEIEIANQAIVEQYSEKLFKEELERKEMAIRFHVCDYGDRTVFRALHHLLLSRFGISLLSSLTCPRSSFGVG